MSVAADNLKTWERFSEIMCSKYGYKKSGAGSYIRNGYVVMWYRAPREEEFSVSIGFYRYGKGRPVLKDIPLPLSNLRLKTCKIGKRLAIVVYEEKTRKIIGVTVSREDTYQLPAPHINSYSFYLKIVDGRLKGTSVTYILPRTIESYYQFSSLKTAIKNRFAVFYNFLKLTNRNYYTKYYFYFTVNEDEVGIYLKDSSYLSGITYINECSNLPDMIPILNSSGKEESFTYNVMYKISYDLEVSDYFNHITLHTFFETLGLNTEKWLTKFTVYCEDDGFILNLNEFISLRPINFSDLEKDLDFRGILFIKRPDLLDKVLNFLKST